MSKYLRYFIGLLSSKVVRAAINILFIALLARVLGPNGLGEWTLVIAAGALLHSFLLSWMHAPTIPFGREEWQRQRTISVTWSARLPYILAGFVLTGCLVILDPAQWVESFFHLYGGMKLAILLALFWLWLSVETQNFLLLREGMFKLALMPVFIDGAPVLILMVIIVSRIVLPGYALITGLLISNVMLWSMALYLELKHLKVHWARPNTEVAGKIFNYAWPLIPGFMLAYVSDWGDQLLIRYFFNIYEVGLFQAAYQVMILLLGVTAPLGMIILPRLIDKEKLSSYANEEFLSNTGPSIITLGLFLIVPLVSFAPFCFRILMGNGFADAMPVFIVLCSAIPGVIIATFYGVFFSLQGRLWRSNVIYFGIMSVTNVLISLMLLPRIGILGSAIATSISYLIVQFLYLADQHHYYRISSGKGHILFGAILAFAVFQAVIGEGLLIRFMLCLISLTVLIFLARKYSLLNRECVLHILSGKLRILGDLMVRVIEPHHRG